MINEWLPINNERQEKQKNESEKSRTETTNIEQIFSLFRLVVFCEGKMQMARKLRTHLEERKKAQKKETKKNENSEI